MTILSYRPNRHIPVGYTNKKHTHSNLNNTPSKYAVVLKYQINYSDQLKLSKNTTDENQLFLQSHLARGSLIILFSSVGCLTDGSFDS